MFVATYCFPTQPRPPLANAKNNCLRSLSPVSSNHRSGLKVLGSGNTSWLIRCVENAWLLTMVFSGMKKPSTVRPPLGTYRGRDIGIAGKHLSPSSTTASKYGNLSGVVSLCASISSCSRFCTFRDLGCDISHIRKHKASEAAVRRQRRFRNLCTSLGSTYRQWYRSQQPYGPNIRRPCPNAPGRGPFLPFGSAE